MFWHKKITFESFHIPEPTKSLLWVTNEELNKLEHPDSMTIRIDLKGKVTSSIRDGETIYADPSLIWLKLPLDEAANDDSNNFSFKYSGLTANQRYKYLYWLQDITQETDHKFLMIYFLGLERHLYSDNFEKSSIEALRLLHNQTHLGFRYYAIPSLLYAVKYHNRVDILKKFPFLLDQPTNIGFYLQYIAGIKIYPKQVINLANEVNFYNKLYIKKYPELFERELQSLLDEFEVENGNIFDFCNINNSSKKETFYIYNRSLPDSILKQETTNIIGQSTFRFLLNDMLNQTHQIIKEKTLKRNNSNKQQIKSKPKRLSKNRTVKVNYENGTLVKENLPYPFVYYPGSYGAFFGFKKQLISEIHFCTCSQKAIQNYIRLRLCEQKSTYSDNRITYLISIRDFPQEFVEYLMNNNVEENEEIINFFLFADNICHECNNSTPKLSYTHPMYGGLFVQKYGWYIQKQYYELGISSHIFTSNYLKDVCPPEIQALIENKKSSMDKLKSGSSNTDNNFELTAAITKLNRPFEKEIENRVRIKFGHKKIGEAWTGETILFYIVKKIFPTYEILRHYKPKYLNGLEFDVFIKELNIAYEYQGVQHFLPVEHWGGKKALENLQERDNRKREIANSLKIPLIYVNFDDELTEEFINDKTKPFIKENK